MLDKPRSETSRQEKKTVGGVWKIRVYWGKLGLLWFGACLQCDIFKVPIYLLLGGFYWHLFFCLDTYLIFLNFFFKSTLFSLLLYFLPPLTHLSGTTPPLPLAFIWKNIQTCELLRCPYAVPSSMATKHNPMESYFRNGKKNSFALWKLISMMGKNIHNCIMEF